jgi:hypothetical protein
MEDEMFEPVTVHYEDEGPITYGSEAERHLLEGAKYEMKTTVREVIRMARAIAEAEIDLLAGMDPIQATGEEFIFPMRCGPHWISGEVPEPFANVDLRRAWDVAQGDAHACRRVLETDSSIEASLRVFANSIRWAQFWSIRCPRVEGRIMFSQTLERLEEALERLRSKALEKGNLKVLEGLKMENEDA